MKYLATLTLLVLTTVAQAASPAVNATLSLPRTQPRHFVEAALTLLDLGAPDEAETIVTELAGQPLTDEQYVTLVDQVGTARLARLGREVPAAAPVVDKALAAASAAATSPARMQGLVDQLTGEREQALAAIRALRLTGPAGVDYCMTQLAKADDPKLRARLREALVALDPISQPAIFAALGSDNHAVATEAAYAIGRLAELGRIRTSIAQAMVAGCMGRFGPESEAESKAAFWAYTKLTGKNPTLDDTLPQLDAAIDELLAGAVLFPDGVEAPANLNVQLAASLANDQVSLLPGRQRLAQRAFMLELENGDERMTGITPIEDVSAVLGDALTRNLHTAARLAAQTLGQRGDEAALYAANGELSPLAKALDSPHPAVRFAAAEAIVAINPQRPFAGSSRLADALLYFAAAEGDDIAVVASPQLARAGETAGWLMGAGYVALPANRGEDALRIATASPDTTLILIDMSVSLPGARETIFRLRRSPETALVPIAVLAADGRLSEAQRIADEHGGERAGIIALPRPHSPEATASMAQRLVSLAPADWPHADTRLRNAEAAKKAIAGLLANGPKIYGFDRRAEQVAIVAGLGKNEESLATLVALGTPESQQRLLDAASLEARPVADRNAAADAFAESVAAHGILLTTDQLRRQYDRYNLSATAPAETQAVLGRLLDVIEKKSEAPMTKPQ